MRKWIVPQILLPERNGKLISFTGHCQIAVRSNRSEIGKLVNLQSILRRWRNPSGKIGRPAHEYCRPGSMAAPTAVMPLGAQGRRAAGRPTCPGAHAAGSRLERGAGGRRGVRNALDGLSMGAVVSRRGNCCAGSGASRQRTPGDDRGHGRRPADAWWRLHHRPWATSAADQCQVASRL